MITILNNAAPLILAAMGGLLTELAGVLNIALEGMILTGAFASIIAIDLTGNPGVSALAGMAAGLGAAGLFSFSSFRLKGNIFITGLGINILMPALIASLSQHIYRNQGIIRPALTIHLPKAAGLDIYTGASLLLSLLLFLFLYHTYPGLTLRASGVQQELLRSRGIRPERVQTYAVLSSGILSGLAGAALAQRLGAFVPGMSAGKGWIALVAIYLGYRKIPGIMAACLLFVAAETFSNRIQGSMQIPPTLILSFPYFITLFGLWIFAVWNKKKY